MSTGTAGLGRTLGTPHSSAVTQLKTYFAADSTRAIQSALGLIWLLDGALQFQSFMYSRGFLAMIDNGASGQPAWLSASIRWSTRTAGHNLTVFNTLFALTQVAIGIGLLYRPTVRPALAVSLAWSLVVWWFGEAFGMLFMNMANPLTGAPGAVSLYVLVGLLVWPNRRPGGLLGVSGTRIMWASLWLVFSWLWLLGANSSPSATRDAINAAPSGMSWLSTVQNWAANGSAGHGLVIAVVLSLICAMIGIGVAAGWHVRPLIILAIVLGLVFWVFGQGFGGIFEGDATDPNSGPLIVLLALAVHQALLGQRATIKERSA